MKACMYICVECASSRHVSIPQMWDRRSGHSQLHTRCGQPDADVLAEVAQTRALDFNLPFERYITSCSSSGFPTKLPLSDSGEIAVSFLITPGAEQPFSPISRSSGRIARAIYVRVHFGTSVDSIWEKINTYALHICSRPLRHRSATVVIPSYHGYHHTLEWVGYLLHTPGHELGTFLNEKMLYQNSLSLTHACFVIGLVRWRTGNGGFFG